MAHLVLALLVYVSFVLEIGAREDVALHGVAPGFLLLALSVAFVWMRDHSAIAWAAIIGFLMDCTSSGLLGISMFCCIAAVFALRRMLPKRKSYYAPATIGICALLTFTVLVASTVARSLIAGKGIEWSTLLTVTSAGAGYTAGIYTALRLKYAGLTALLRRIPGANNFLRGGSGSNLYHERP